MSKIQQHHPFLSPPPRSEVKNIKIKPAAIQVQPSLTNQSSKNSNNILIEINKEQEDDSFNDLLPPNRGILIIKVVEAKLFIEIS